MKTTAPRRLPCLLPLLSVIILRLTTGPGCRALIAPVILRAHPLQPFASLLHPPTTRRFVSWSDEQERPATGSPAADTTRLSSQQIAADVDWDWKSVVQHCFSDRTTTTSRDESRTNCNKPIILFDGVCLFCNAGVDLCARLDRQESFRFASLQSRVGQSLLLQHGKQPDDISSIVLVESPEMAYFESDAILRIAKELKGLPWVVRSMSKVSLRVVPLMVRNGAYHVIANNRYVFGHLEEPAECRLDLDGSLSRRFVEDPSTIIIAEVDCVPTNSQISPLQ
jgi:predicted DCC family thiol-disulfide oxidoreductase YuxK